jgi:protein SCO1/2
MSRTRKFLAAACAALSLTLAGCGRQDGPGAVAAEADAPGFGGDFSLTNQDGRAFRLQDLRGKAVLMFFGYTSCPDMCPMTMSRIMSALETLGGQAAEVVTLFVSVDPGRDTPAALKEYVGSFSTPLVGLTGTKEEIARVAAAYHASFETVETGTPNYLINHTTAIFLIDRRGQLRQYFPNDEDPAKLAAALRAVLKEK